MDLHTESDDKFQKRLLSIFKKEALGHLNTMFNSIIEIEQKGLNADHKDIIDRLFRCAHSLKGSSRTVNILSIESICQVIEEIFYDIKKDNLSINEPLLHSINNTLKIIELIINNPDEQIEYEHAITQLINIKKKGGQIYTEEQKPLPVIDTSYPITTDSYQKQEPYNFIKIETALINSLITKVEEIISLKGFLKYHKESLISAIQKTKAIAKDTDLLITNINMAEFKKHTKAIYEELSELLLRNIAFERFITTQIDDIIFDIKTIALLPLNELFEPLPRMVRDIASERGKKINITFQGGDIKVDRRILEGIRDPIIHIIRNAIDHGIETPAERGDSGKPEIGTIKIKAYIETGKQLVLEIMDDGKGIDINNLRNKLHDLGILDNQQAQHIDDTDIVQYIFRQEVSTSREVTNISGRGLGLSIANESTEKLGGFIKVYTEFKKGTIFVLTIPMDVTNLNIILFKTSNNSIYGISTNNVEAVKRVALDEIKTIEGKNTIQYKDTSVSIMPIETVLQIPTEPNTDETHIVVLIIRHGGRIIAFKIKEIMHEEEVSLKDLGYNLKRVRNFTGAATIKSGETILIINPADLMKSATTTRSITSIQQLTKPKEITKKSILLVEDSITARTLFKNILESAGYEVTTAVDGIDAFTTLKTGKFDIVVTDVKMPRMDGFELTAKIRGDSNLFRTPVVLVTGLETRRDKEKGMEVGANAYIVKSSFDQSNLIDVVKRLI